MSKLSETLGLLIQPGIGRRFALWILAFSSVVTLLSTVMQLTLEFSRDVIAIESELDQIRESYSNSLASSLWVTSQKDVQLQLDGVFRMPDMQYLEVRSDQGLIVAVAGTPADQRIRRQETPLYFEYQGKPVYVGKLVIVASLDGVYQRLKDKVVVILITQTIKTFLVSLFILFLFQLLVGRHLNKIAQHAEILGRGSTDLPLELERAYAEGRHKDELDQLVGAFNKMSRRLEAAYQNLKESEENARLMVESVQDYAILRLDPQGRVASWNEGAQRINGYRADEIIGRPYSVFYLPEEVAAGRPEQLLKQAETAGRCKDEGWRVRKDGSRFWADVSITALFDSNGKLRGYSKVARDITQRKQAEAQLRAYQEQLENMVAERTRQVRDQAKIIDQIHDSVVTTDMQGVVTGWNHGAERLFGYSAQEAMGKPITFVYPEEEHGFLSDQVISPLLSNGAHEVEVRMRRKSGEVFYAHLSLSLLYDEEGTPRGMAGFSIDITARKQAEEMLELRSQELAVINQELESFSYSVSHDLRAPLRGIDGFSLALLEDYGDRLDSTAKDYLNRVRSGTLRMSTLIDDLLKLSRVSRTAMEPSSVNLSALAGDIVKHLRETAPDRAVEISIQDGLTAQGDPGLLEAALGNLLGNAWKYSAKNSRPRIEFGCAEQDGETVYFVRDNGAGFDMAHAGNLFGAFQRLHHRDEFEGTGIGLATVKRIIHRHGGRIWAEAAPGEGATFYFTLAAQAACH